MRKLVLGLLLAAAVAALGAASVIRGGSPQGASASSHREAPLISQDPTADNTDLYAFVSPDKPDTATIVSNWIPGEDPAAGPNYYTFSPTARYDIYIDKNGDGIPDITYRFRFKNLASQYFLGNTQQSYTATKIVGDKTTVVGSGLLTPPDNIGPRSTPDYASLAAKGIHTLDDGSTVFAGQRDDAFFADVGAIFDLVAIRVGTGASGGGKDFLAGYGVHAIALQIPKSMLDNGTNHTIGVWAATDRQEVTVSKGKAKKQWVQVSRLGNPLVNEVVIPTNLKDYWNSTTPDKVNRLGVLGGDLAGYPNGRRLEDDVIDISERAVGGALVGHSLPLGDGVDRNDIANLTSFPYEPDPFSGFDDTKGKDFPKTG